MHGPKEGLGRKPEKVWGGQIIHIFLLMTRLRYFNKQPATLTRLIIYTIDCKSSSFDSIKITAQTTALQDALAEMVGTAYRTIRRACGGFFFWISMTKAHIDTLMKFRGSPIIVPDKKFEIVLTYSV